MANEKLAKELIIKVFDSISGAWETVARTTSYSFEVNKETVDITSFDSNGWKEFLVDLKEFNLSGDGIVVRTAQAGFVNYEELLTSLINSDTALAVQFINPAVYTSATDGTSFAHEVVKAFLTSLPVAGSLGDKQTYSFTMSGTGAVTLVKAKYDSEAEAFAAEAAFSTGDVILVTGNIAAGVTGYYERSANGSPASFADAWTAYTI
jgi:predicted secreted protein